MGSSVAEERRAGVVVFATQAKLQTQRVGEHAPEPQLVALAEAVRLELVAGLAPKPEQDTAVEPLRERRRAGADQRAGPDRNAQDSNRSHRPRSPPPLRCGLGSASGRAAGIRRGS